ncbi:DUF4214 domain-containing protein [Halomonas lysinitropha]|uniref:Poly(Beta-D-mannuronate) C5 epimerase 7 n=1 Tax=Halomonas lysinitropha TaxID=2607506 RepID=A0A5K1I5H4_9GAMM|nr:DUF4214 domain-containing protein [Halomonas lysinitropha]VVZ95273.1 Poly(beta-D-mannuronate) C5 epimerase 7 [Halomonas lysinitropha]
MATQESLDLVQKLYVAYYGRPSDSEGQEYWATRIDEEGVDAVINEFGTSPEFEARFGNFTPDQLITNLYNQLFGRQPEEAGKEYWLGVLRSGEKGLAEIALTIANAAQNEDALALSNKLEVAQNFTDALDEPNELQAYSGNVAANSMRQFLFNVNEDTVPSQVDVDDAINGLVDATLPGESGNVFTLAEMPEQFRLFEGLDLTSLETFQGFSTDYITTEKLAPVLMPTTSNDGVVQGGLTGGGNDRIYADAYALHGAVVDGAGGSNSLFVDMKGPFSQPTMLLNIQTVTVTNLYNVYDSSRSDFMELRSSFGEDSVLDLSRAIDIENLVVREGSQNFGDLDIWNIQNGATATLEGFFNGDVRLDFGGSLDAVNVVLSNVRTDGSHDFEVSHNAGQVNLTSDGRLNILDGAVFGQFLDTLVIDGDARLFINDEIFFRDELPATIDASATTGGVSISLDDHAEVIFTGGSGNDVLTVEGELVNGDEIILLTADMGTGNDQITFDDDGTIVQDGSLISGENVTLFVEESVDISEAQDLFAPGTEVSVVLQQGETITLTQAQFDAIGAEDFSLANRADDADISLLVTEDFDVTTVNVAGLEDGIDLTLNIQEGVELTMTGDEFVDLALAGVTFAGDGDLSVSGVTQANVDDLAAAGATTLVTGNNGDTSYSFAEDVTVPAGLELGDFSDNVSHDLGGNTLTLAEEDQADELTVSNGNIILDFVGPASGGVSMDMANYTDILSIQAYELLLARNTNVEELFKNLASSIEGIQNIINVVETPVALLDLDRIVTIEAGVTKSAADLQFVTPTDADTDDNVQNVTLNLLGDSSIVGDIVLDLNDTKNGTFQTLMLNSEGAASNTIDGDILADGTSVPPGVLAANTEENDLLDVVINADSELDITGTIYFSEEGTGPSTATLTVNGTADVTVKALDTTDTQVSGLVIDTTGYTGTLTVTGGSDSLQMDATESLVFTGSGDIVLDTDTGTGNNGIEGNTLSVIDASGLSGDLTLGVIEDIDSQDFTFTAGTGTTTFTLDGVTLNSTPGDASWTFNLNTDTVMTIEDLTVIDTANDTSLTIGGGGTVLIDGSVDLSAIDNLDLSGAAAPIQVASGASLTLTAAQADGLSIEGDGSLEIVGEYNGEDFNNFNVSNISLATVTLGTATEVTMDLSAFSRDFNITGSGVADVITTGSGNDIIDGNAGDDTLNGGLGDDELTGGTGADTFVVNDGSDTITDLTTGDALQVGAGATATANDVTAFVATADTSNTGGTAILNAEAGVAANIDMTAATGTDGYTLNGDDLNDTLVGSDFDDVINGGAGNDTLTGGAGDDVINGGEGIDTIAGGAGDDVITGGAGNDIIDATGGSDTIIVDADTDTINNLENGDDLQVAAGATADAYLSGTYISSASTTNDGDATLNMSGTGLGVDMSLAGGANGWTINGAASNDNIVGSAQDDVINGGAGADNISGLAGDDTITGGADSDTLTGGLGADIFNFADRGINDGTFATTVAASTIDTITDFDTTEGDQVQFDDSWFDAGSATNYTENLTAEANLSDVFTNADAALGGGVTYYFGVHDTGSGNDGYLFFDDIGDGWETVVQLQGLSDFDFNDIIVA